MSTLAIHGGTPTIDRPGRHVTWPPITEDTTAAVLAQLQTAISIPGRAGVIAKLEDRLADYFGVRHAVTNSSGTTALYSMYTAVGLEPGDEVIAPAYTFLATVTPLFHLGVKPVLVDCDQWGNIDPAAVRAAITPRTKAIIATHLWGVPAAMMELTAVAQHCGLALLEDGSHGHGSAVNGRKVGSFGTAAAFSMNGPKPLSAGEGGFVLTDDDDVHARLLLHGHYNTRCKQDIDPSHPLWKYRTTGMGLKLRLHPLAAAIAFQQLEHLDEYVAGRRAIAQRFRERLQGLPGIAVPEVLPGVEVSGYALCLRYRPEEVGNTPIGVIMAALNAEGCTEIDQPGSTCPLSDHPLFQDPHELFPYLPAPWPTYEEGQFPHAKHLWENTLKITISHHDNVVTDAYIDAITKVMGHYRRNHGA